MLEWLHRPWPWYVTGPLLGLVATGLLMIGNKQLGVSGNFRHLCAAVFPRNVAFGTASAGGCPSGHGTTGLADLQLASLIAVVAFFAAGALASHFLLPLLLSG